jgi:hypothetical protein
MKNIDLIFIQYLESYNNQATILDMKRIGVEESEWSDETKVKVINKFFTETDVRKSSNTVPDEVLSIMTDMTNTSDISEVNKLISALRTHGFEFLMIERFDLSKVDIIEIDESAVMFGYIWNYKKANSELICYAIGSALPYTQNNYKSGTAGDFISIFNLTDDELKMNGISAAKVSYDILKEKDDLKSFDDSGIIVFLNARDWEYCKIYNS